MNRFIKTKIEGVYIIEPQLFGDNRGYFMEVYNKLEFDNAGLIYNFVQDNQSKSKAGVLRGLHFQKDPKCQAKIVEVISGKAIDVVVDIREDSETYGKWTSVLLTPDNNRQLFVPRGFAHGFVALEDDTVFHYLIDNDYAPEMEDGILWNDPEIGINWDEMFSEYGIDKPLLSDKDINREPLSKCKTKFRRNK